MVCENCKHEIGPEDKFCPKCGARNVFAETHQENMQQFAQDFTATEKKVSGFAQAVEGLGKKAAVLVVLIVGTIVFSLIAASLYEGPGDDSDSRRGKVKTEAFGETADELLARGEYMEYVSYTYSCDMMNFPPEELNRFDHVRYVAERYYQCMQYIEQMILRSDNPDYFDWLDTNITNFSLYLDDFCEVYAAQTEGEKDEKYLGYMQDMEAELRATMRTYFAMEEEGVQELLKMGKAQKAVKVREVLRHEEE